MARNFGLKPMPVHVITKYHFHSLLGVLRQTVKPGTPPDFILKVTIDRHPVRFFVHKRPHVDFFLNIVSMVINMLILMNFKLD